MPIEVDPHDDPRTYFASAFGIGIVAAGVMTALGEIARATRLTEFSLPMSLGTASVFSDWPSAGAWVQGFIVMLLCGGIFALVYAALFELFGYRARAWEGALIGIIHALIGGVLLAWLMPVLHTSAFSDSRLADPGFVAIHYGRATAAIFVGLHMIFGAMVGGWLHASPLATRHLRIAADHHHHHDHPAPV